MTPSPSLDLEREIVASLLVEPDSAAYLEQALSPDDIESEPLRAVYCAALDVWREHSTVDLPLLTERLRRLDLWDQGIDGSLIGWLLDRGGSLAQLPAYVARVIEIASARRLQFRGAMLAQERDDVSGAAMGVVLELGADRTSWPDPVPLTGLEHLPAFPVDALPEVLAEWCAAVAESIQVPVDLPAMVCLAALGASAAKVWRVRVKADYSEPLNLWTIVAAAPSTRKSPVFSAAIRPIAEWEAREQRDHRGDVAQALARLETEKKTLAGMQSKAARCTIPHERDDLLDRVGTQAALVAELEEAAPVGARVYASDVTPEALAQLLAQYHGRMAVLADEGGIVGTIMGRYDKGGKANLDVFLHGYSGGDVKVDRMSRGTTTVKAAAVTLGLCVQPQVLREAWADPAVRERGLLARPLYAVPRDVAGERLTAFEAPPVPSHLSDAYAATIHRLLARRPTVRDGEVMGELLYLSPGAAEVLHLWAAEVESDQRPDGRMRPITEWAGKCCGNTLRVAGLLHLAAGLDERHQIGADTAEAAVTIGRWAAEQALALFADLGEGGRLGPARAVLDVIVRSGKRVITRDELRQDGRLKRRGIGAGELTAALAVLREGYYVASEDGRRFVVSPKAGVA